MPSKKTKEQLAEERAKRSAPMYEYIDAPEGYDHNSWLSWATGSSEFEVTTCKVHLQEAMKILSKGWFRAKRDEENYGTYELYREDYVKAKVGIPRDILDSVNRINKRRDLEKYATFGLPRPLSKREIWQKFVLIASTEVITIAQGVIIDVIRVLERRLRIGQSF